jgi:hypothetical protein
VFSSFAFSKGVLNFTGTVVSREEMNSTFSESDLQKAWVTPERQTPVKHLVVAAHFDEDVSWLNELSQHFQEAMAYLTFILQNYDNLPESLAFVHSHLSSWHTNGSQLERLLSIPCWESIPYASITKHSEFGRNFARTSLRFMSYLSASTLDRKMPKTLNRECKARNDTNVVEDGNIKDTTRRSVAGTRGKRQRGKMWYSSY